MANDANAPGWPDAIRADSGAAAPRAIGVAGAALVVLGFFLPWLHGTAEFAARDFSGFDLARLVRNFEIVASSSSEEGQFGLITVALYAMPALAINGAVLAFVPAIQRRAAAIALGIAAFHALVILTMFAALSAISWTNLQGVLGSPMNGFFVSVAGGATLCVSAALAFHRARI